MGSFRFLFVLLCLCSIELMAQPTTFMKTYNSGETGYCVREVGGNAYVIAGSTDYYYNFQWFIMSPTNTTKIHVVKANVDGGLIWEKIIAYPGNRMFATWIEHTNDDGFIVTGRSGHDAVWPPDSNDVVLIKTDSGGNPLWAKNFDTGGDELAFSVKQTNDGGYIVSAFHDAVPMSLAGNTYAMLIKTDANGNLLWNKKYQFAVRDLDTGEGLVWVVKQTSNGGYILVGTTAASHAADAYIIRTDSNGDVVWARSYEHDNTFLRFSMGLDIIETWTGDFVMAGSLDKDQTLSQYNYPFILKINSTGDILDSRFYDSNPPQMFQSGFSSVEQTADGGFFFTGMGGYGGFGMQAQLLKTDVNFTMDWSRSYTNDAAATMGSHCGISTSDGCFAFTGKKLNTGSVLMKTDHFGLIPCKTPGTLVEMIPAMVTHSYSPVVLSGINSTDIVLMTTTGLNDTSTVCNNSLAILPIELLSFTGQQNAEKKIELNWITASETNNDYFRVERSDDGNTFSQIGIVKGSGNSTTRLEYGLTDSYRGSSKILYYRLNQFDYDGKNHYSKTIAVRIQNSFVATASSNFSEHTIQYNLQSEFTENAMIVVRDVVGKEILRKNISLEKGFNQIRLEMNNASTGIYSITFSSEDMVAIEKIFY